MHRFPTPRRPQLVIELRAGTIAIDTDEVDEATIDLHDRVGDTSDALRDTVIEQRGDAIVVFAPKHDGLWHRTVELDLRATVPVGTALRIATGSAPITARGRYATTSVHSGSGDVDVEAVDGDADVSTGSGRIAVGSVTGAANAKSGSGDVEIGTAGTSVRVKTGSGDVSVARGGDELRASTGSGDVRIDSVDRGNVNVRVASGDIRAGVRAGTAAWLDVRTVSGRVSSELESTPGPGEADQQVRLHLQSVSGDIELLRV